MHTLIKTLSGAKILTETLKLLGVDTIFGYPGGIVLNVYDELSKQSSIKHYLVRHEQAAVHAAEGYARVSGKCGVVLVTSGPGATNVVTGLANAYLDNYPLLVITGQVSKELLHKDAFQEVDIVDITKSCVKKAFQVRDVKDLQKTLQEAYRIAMDGRKGPVVVDVTKNVFSEHAEFSEHLLVEEEQKISFDVSKVFQLLEKSERPLVIAGGGVVQANASEELNQFIKIFNIPVVTSMMGLGAISTDDENNLGMIGIFGSANSVVRQSDLIIAIGTRFNDRITCCFPNNELGKNLVHIDIDEKEISKVVPACVGIVGDAKKILSEINLKNNLQKDFSNWLKDAINISLKTSSPQKRSNLMHSYEVMQRICEILKSKNTIVSTEVGQHQVWAARYLKFNEARKFLTSGGLGTMGFGFPAAIGACVGLNKQPVVCIAGDGSFQMNMQELATCMDYGLPVKVFILNNGCLGMVRQFQEKMCDKRYYATDISNPDFEKLAIAYGAKAIKVTRLDEVEVAVNQAFEYDGPFIIDFLVEHEELL